MRRGVHLGLGALGIAGGIGFAAASCGSASGGVYDLEYVVTCAEWKVVSCKADVDCYSGFTYELGTRCINSHCLCPVEGWVMCNKRGHPQNNAMRQCWPIEECEPGEYCIADEEPPPPPPEPECTKEDLSKCPGPPDKRCGVAT